MDFVEIREGEVVDKRKRLGYNKVMENTKKGVYTTARTVGNKFYEFSFHLDRIAKGMKDAGESPENVDEFVKSMLIPSLRTGIHQFELEFGKHVEKRIHVIASRDESMDGKHKWGLVIQIERMPNPPQRPIQIAIIPGHRENPTIKNIEWTAARKQLEAKMQPIENEVVMCDDKLFLYEGLSSNFGVLFQGKVYTAPPSVVLMGSIIKGIKAACERLNIEVVEQQPNLQDIEQWDAAFISSTSRLMLNIDVIRYDGDKFKKFLENTTIEKIQHELHVILRENSVDFDSLQHFL